MIYNSSIEYPHISPLRWVDPLSPARYVRLMGLTDTWRVQFLSDNDLSETFKLHVYSYRYGYPLGSFDFTKATLSTGKHYWDAYQSASTIYTAIQALNIPYLLNDLCVVFKLQVGSVVWAESHPVLLGSHTNTKQILVWNSSNDFGTVFGEFKWNNCFGMRVEAEFENGYYKPSGTYETFANQLGELTVVDSTPAGDYTLTIGDGQGLTDDAIEQLSWWLSCDTIIVDFVAYVKKSMDFIENEKRGTRQIRLVLSPMTNRNTQNILGEEILLMNEEGNLLTDEVENVLAI